MTPRGEQRVTLALWATGWLLLTLAAVLAIPPFGPVILAGSAGFACLSLGGLRLLIALAWQGIAAAVRAGSTRERGQL